MLDINLLLDAKYRSQIQNDPFEINVFCISQIVVAVLDTPIHRYSPSIDRRDSNQHETALTPDARGDAAPICPGGAKRT